MDEFELIRRYFACLPTAPDVRVGIGDDGAVLRPTPGRDLVTVVDTLVQGVHFTPDIDAADLGFRAVAVNLSDIAAMGARPRWMLLALTLPAAEATWLERFAAGLQAAASAHDVVLVGGDTTRGDIVVISVQIVGDVAPDAVMMRSGARPGDRIFVTGTVGDAAAGLTLLAGGQTDNILVRRFLRPAARVAYGRALAGQASAAIDISDGLVTDLDKLLAASGVGGEIECDRLPISAALRSRFDADTCLDFALAGGDDYELCFTFGDGEVPQADDLAVTEIGVVRGTPGLDCRRNGKPYAHADSGYRHFR